MTGLSAFSRTRLFAVTFPVMMHVNLVANLVMMMRVCESRSGGKNCHASGQYGENSFFHESVVFER